MATSPHTKQVREHCPCRKNFTALPVAIFLLVISTTAAIDTFASSEKGPGTILTGKFVARIDGPRLTGFGLNHDYYVFEMFSPVGSQLVTLSYTFLIYQPHLPLWALDYSKLYRIPGARDNTCEATLEKISKHYVFDSNGDFVEIKYAITYAKNFPARSLSLKSPLPCYVVSPKDLSFGTVP